MKFSKTAVAVAAATAISALVVPSHAMADTASGKTQPGTEASSPASNDKDESKAAVQPGTEVSAPAEPLESTEEVDDNVQVQPGTETPAPQLEQAQSQPGTEAAEPAPEAESAKDIPASQPGTETPAPQPEVVERTEQVESEPVKPVNTVEPVPQPASDGREHEPEIIRDEVAVADEPVLVEPQSDTVSQQVPVVDEVNDDPAPTRSEYDSAPETEPVADMVAASAATETGTVDSAVAPTEQVGQDVASEEVPEVVEAEEYVDPTAPRAEASEGVPADIPAAEDTVSAGIEGFTAIVSGPGAYAQAEASADPAAASVEAGAGGTVYDAGVTQSEAGEVAATSPWGDTTIPAEAIGQVQEFGDTAYNALPDPVQSGAETVNNGVQSAASQLPEVSHVDAGVVTGTLIVDHYDAPAAPAEPELATGSVEEATASVGPDADTMAGDIETSTDLAETE